MIVFIHWTFWKPRYWKFYERCSKRLCWKFWRTYSEIAIRESVFCATEELCFILSSTRIFSWNSSKVSLIALPKSSPEKLLLKFFMLNLMLDLKDILRWLCWIFMENYVQNGVNQAFLGPKSLAMKFSLNLLIFLKLYLIKRMENWLKWLFCILRQIFVFLK